MPNERHYDVIDYLKFFCAFLVIAIHTRPFLTFSEIADTIYNRDISNYAVPFFYACTGFLLTVRNQNIPFERKLKSSIRKITKSYFVWTAIYLPLTIYGWISSGKSLLINLILFIRNFLFVGENYYSWTLWYLNGLIFCLVLLLFLHRKLSLMQIFKLSSLLYLAGLILEIGRECSGVLPVYLQYAIKIYYSLFCTVRNGLFRSLVFVVLGIMIGSKVKDGTQLITLRTVFATIALYILKIPLSLLGGGYAGQMLDLPTFYGIFSVIAYLTLHTDALNHTIAKTCRYLSEKIYHVHMYFVALCVFAFHDDTAFNFLSFVIVSISAFGVAILMCYLEKFHFLNQKGIT